jgi:hypothetical protein
MDPDADPDPAIFLSSDANKKLIFKESLMLIRVLFEGTFTSFFKDKKLKRSHKAVEIKVFITIVLGDKGIRRQIRIQEAQKHTDPQH